ncbi:hypothetical protein [Streptomyces dysideae]|uniref:hypothetical protein n=1 Tax=Streptomyces dysideae TaxID=909626 RepID=UPI0008373DBC|nr:hypothetical protein [Streptomyces dysideae]
MAVRETFDEDPKLYDRARPRYPSALVDELARTAGLGPGRRVLEVGPGRANSPFRWRSSAAR